MAKNQHLNINKNLAIFGILLTAIAVQVGLFKGYVSYSGVFMMFAVLWFFILFISKPYIVLNYLMLTWGAFHIFLNEQVIFTFQAISLNFNKILGVTMLLGLGLYLSVEMLKNPVTLIFVDKIQTIYFALSVYAGISVIYSPFRVQALVEWLKIFSGTVLFLGIPVIYEDERKQKIFIKFLLFAGIIAAILTIFSYFLSRYGVIGTPLLKKFLVFSSGVARAKGTLGGAGATGAFLLVELAILLLFNDIFAEKKGLIYFGVGVIIIAIFTTLTRASILGLFMFFILYSYGKMKIHREITRFLKSIIGIVIVVALSLTLIGESALRNRLEDVPFIGKYTSLKSPQIGQGRISQWTTLINAYLKDFNLIEKIFGKGLYATHVKYHGPYAEVTSIFGSHNDFIYLLVNLGIVGLMLYLIFLYKCLRLSQNLCNSENKRKKLIGNIIKVSVLTYSLTQSMFLDTINTTGHRWFFLSLLAIGMSMGKKENKETL